MLRLGKFDYVQEHKKEVEEWIRQMHEKRDKKMREKERIERFEAHKKKMEEQLPKRSKSKFSSSSKISSSNWKEEPKKEGASFSKEAVSTYQRKKPLETTPRSRDVKCFKCLGHGHIAFQCPTKRATVSRSGELVSQSKASSEKGKTIPEGDLFMVRRLLGTQPKEQDDSQRGSIFQSRCLIQGKICSLIIDGGSCVNIVSSRLILKLNLVTKEHPQPYKLQWLSEVGEIVVNKQVEISFSIGKYNDSVLCDVAPMEASHVLLGRPWQFDKKANHDGYTNKFSFMHQDRKVVLSSMSPKEIREDQIKLREKIEQERKESESEKKIEKKSDEKGRESKKKIDEKCEKNSVKNSDGKEKNSERNIVSNNEEKERFLTTKSEEKRDLVPRQPQCIFYCKIFHLVANASNDFSLFSGVVIPLQKIGDFIPKEASYGLTMASTHVSHPLEIHFVLQSNATSLNVRNTLVNLQMSNFGKEDFNSRSNSLKEGGDDMSQGGASQLVNKDIVSPIWSKVEETTQGLGGHMTRVTNKKAQQVLFQIMVLIIEASPNARVDGMKTKMIIYLIQLEDP